MDINFNSNRQFEFSDELSERLSSKIENKLKKYSFVSTVQANLRMENNAHSVSLNLHLKNAEPVFAETTSDKGLIQAFDMTMEKVLRQIEKYKEKHYHSR